MKVRFYLIFAISHLKLCFPYSPIVLKFNLIFFNLSVYLSGILHNELSAHFNAKKFAKVKIFKTKMRQGLIRGRLQAAQKATGEVSCTIHHISLHIKFLVIYKLM